MGCHSLFPQHPADRVQTLAETGNIPLFFLHRLLSHQALSHRAHHRHTRRAITMVTTYRHGPRCSRYGTSTTPSTCYFPFTPHESSLYSPLQFTEEGTELREVESCVQDHTASRAGMLTGCRRSAQPSSPKASCGPRG